MDSSLSEWMEDVPKTYAAKFTDFVELAIFIFVSCDC